MGDKNGQVVAGGNGEGNRLDQLNYPTDVLIDKETASLIICDWENRRVVRWSRRSGTTHGEIHINNILCWGLAMDDQRYLYISDIEKHEVRRYQIGDKNGTLVAGGNGEGAGLNQLNVPTYIFVDQQQTVYVSDRDNHRVMKWNKDAKEGIVVAGGQGEGNALTQLSHPQGLFVDTLGTIYVADTVNDRVMRWPKGAKLGTVIVGGNDQLSVPIVIPNIAANERWKQNGVTVAGGHGKGSATNQLNEPFGLFVDDDQTIVIADCWNHRIIQWKMGDTNGQVVAGGHGQGDRLDQLYQPTDVLIDKETDSLIICDSVNLRVVRWSRRSGTTQGEILINNIDCWGLAMDDQRYLYISDRYDTVRRYQIGDKNGTIVAGGNDYGADLNQLNGRSYIFVDQQQTVYVSDYSNHRVMKWNKGAKEGIVVAGGQGEGNALAQLSRPQGLFVDTLGTIYVADSENNRVMRWPKGAKQGTVIVDGN
ncbi:unnamed protein product, partial [Rotaria sordida]